MTEFLLYSKRCFIEGRFIEATLHIKGRKIHQIYLSYYSENALPFLDYSDLTVIPGIIDAHVHINEPGRTHWEGFDTATKAAAVGGITSLIEMPLNAIPVTTKVDAFKIKLEASKNKLHVNCGFYGGIVPGNINDIEPLIKEGVFGIKGFLTDSGIPEFQKVVAEDLEAAAPVLKKYDIPLLLHCELEDDLVPEIQNPKSYTAYMASRPQRWETNAIDLALQIQKKFNIRVHIVHLSASEGLAPILARKSETEALTVETCPHYLFFNAEDIPDASPIYKCAPPIREKYNNDLLWTALLQGSFDFLASDHSPAPPEIKQLDEGDLFKAWGGISGLQLSLPILNTAANIRGLPLENLIPLLTEKPAKFLGLDHRKGKLAVGFDADIVAWNASESWRITENSLLHRHKASPYTNTRVSGKVIHTFVNGVQVVRDAKLNSLNKGTLLVKPLHVSG